MALLCSRARTTHLGRPHLGRFDLVLLSIRVDRFDSGADRLIAARHLDDVSRFREVALVGEGTVEPEGLDENDPGLAGVRHWVDRTARMAAGSTCGFERELSTRSLTTRRPVSSFELEPCPVRREGIPAALPNLIRREEPVTHCGGLRQRPRSGLLALSRRGSRVCSVGSPPARLRSPRANKNDIEQKGKGPFVALDLTTSVGSFSSVPARTAITSSVSRPLGIWSPGLRLRVDFDGGDVRVRTARVYLGNARAKELPCDVLPDLDDVARVREGADVRAEPIGLVAIDSDGPDRNWLEIAHQSDGTHRDDGRGGPALAESRRCGRLGV